MSGMEKLGKVGELERVMLEDCCPGCGSPLLKNAQGEVEPCLPCQQERSRFEQGGEVWDAMRKEAGAGSGSPIFDPQPDPDEDEDEDDEKKKPEPSDDEAEVEGQLLPAAYLKQHAVEGRATARVGPEPDERRPDTLPSWEERESVTADQALLDRQVELAQSHQNREAEPEAETLTAAEVAGDLADMQQELDRMLARVMRLVRETEAQLRELAVLKVRVDAMRRKGGGQP